MQSLDLHTVSSWRDALVASFQNAFNQIIALTPKVVGMVLVLVVGYLVARLLDKFVTALAHSLGLETAAERSGLRASMRQAGIDRSVPWIMGRIVFWLSMCVFVSAAFNILGLETVSTGMETIIAYIPRVLVATVVVVVGLLVATFVRGVIATSADRVGISYADNLAGACYYVIALMTFIGAFDQLGIQFGLLKELILIAFAAVALGFGLAFGLGGREVMAGILAGYYTRQRLHTGDHVTVAGMSGTVREVGPTATVIETEEDGLINRHSVPNTKMLNEAVR
ncbi:MAG TPA: mechanosensitive ion channel domain-containing protein [Pirellulales bacterium]